MTVPRVLPTVFAAFNATSAAAGKRSCTVDLNGTTFDLALGAREAAREAEGVPSVAPWKLSMVRLVGQSAHECAPAAGRL